MASIDIKRMSAKADATQVFQVIYAGSDTHAALLDIYVPTTGANALIIHVGKPGSGLAGAEATTGRAKTRLDVTGDTPGSHTLGEDCKVGLIVTTDSVSDYVGPRLMRFVARTLGSALAA